MMVNFCRVLQPRMKHHNLTLNNTMSPSRGTSDLNPTVETDTDTKANIRSSNALSSAKRNLHYLFTPDSPNTPHPAHLRTRALLRSLRFIGIFVLDRKSVV